MTWWSLFIQTLYIFLHHFLGLYWTLFRIHSCRHIALWTPFVGEAAVSTWLYRIAVNACLMKLRKEKKSRQLTVTGYEDEEVLKLASRAGA